MKIKLTKKMILNNIFSIFLIATVVSCDSVGDSGSESMQSIELDSPTTEPLPDPTVSPTPTDFPPNPPNPTSQPDQPLNEFQSQILDLVNDARAQGRNCGSEFFPSAPAVNWDNRIENAALNHSLDMAENQNFSHTGTDGSNTGDRLLIEGYNWNTWGENILVGLDNAEDAINAWIGSSGHCSIIMNPSLKEVGAGVAQGVFQGNSSS
ncbi:MAG: CAP domain-containing protein, partial [Bacteroidota bacterium]